MIIYVRDDIILSNNETCIIKYENNLDIEYRGIILMYIHELWYTIKYEETNFSLKDTGKNFFLFVLTECH